MPEYAVKTTIYVQPVGSLEEAYREVANQLEVYDPHSNISHWKFDKKTSEMADSMAIVDVTIHVVADDPEEAESDVDSQLEYINPGNRVTGSEVMGVRKRSVRSYTRKKK